ncbi:MAG: DEAD/DEAH box helicase [Planctomycetaceae bacterium]|nr:DEAD/DEAH box helicase [Planctomycetaceae bacterium]
MPSEPSKKVERNFSELGLSEPICQALISLGFSAPTPIQAALIPVALQGIDCIGQARTGTGKTAAFALPMLQQMDQRSEHIQGLILCPTRELGEQVDGEFQKLAANSPVETVLTVGGRPLGLQIRALRKCPQVVIGTPGRVNDLIQRRELDLSHVRFAVLDEADRMLDIGFRKEIERILQKCPQERQTLLLSATLPPEVERLALKYMNRPQRIDLSEDTVVVDTIEQFYCTVEEKKKFGLLIQILLRERPQQAVVFCRTRRKAQAIYEKLKKVLPDVAVIHGELPQRKRDSMMKRLRTGSCRLIIATDIVGRGIDISGISHIINFDIPESSDDYIHRVGRTGRLSSNSDGRAFTFVRPDQGDELTRIEMRINKLLENVYVEGYSAFESKPRETVDSDDHYELQSAPESEWDDIFAELT